MYFGQRSLHESKDGECRHITVTIARGRIFDQILNHHNDPVACYRFSCPYAGMNISTIEVLNYELYLPFFSSIFLRLGIWKSIWIPQIE